jgi:predicted RND superfamily exporter protein
MMGLAALATALVAPGTVLARIRAGLLGAGVSAVPTAVLVVVAAVSRLPLGLPALMIAAIEVGVTVDDTLHLAAALSRCRSATRATLECWRPCVGSSLVGASTLAVFALSPFGPTRQFGVLMAAAVLCGALANHLIVLAILAPRDVRCEPVEKRPDCRHGLVSAKRPPTG